MASSLFGSDVDILCRYWAMEATGESMLTSSLIADELPRGKKGGGGVCIRPSWLLHDGLSLFFHGCRLNAPKRPFPFAAAASSMSMPLSSGMSSRSFRPGTVGKRLGEEFAVMDPSRPVVDVVSLSRTWRMISASRLTSLSTGALSSINSARMRPNCLDFGCGRVSKGGDK